MMVVQSFDGDALVKRIYENLSDAVEGAMLKDLGYHEFDECHLSEIPHL